MVKPNYSFEKRQRDLAKKRKKEEKRKQKMGKADDLPVDVQPDSSIEDKADSSS